MKPELRDEIIKDPNTNFQLGRDQYGDLALFNNKSFVCYVDKSDTEFFVRVGNYLQRAWK